MLERSIALPWMDGWVLILWRDGSEWGSIANLLATNLGVPFGITAQGNDVILTTSDYVPRHFLVWASLASKISTIADLSQINWQCVAAGGGTPPAAP